LPAAFDPVGGLCGRFEAASQVDYLLVSPASDSADFMLRFLRAKPDLLRRRVLLADRPRSRQFSQSDSSMATDNGPALFPRTGRLRLELAANRYEPTALAA
jgi:hypothetical protein